MKQKLLLFYKKLSFEKKLLAITLALGLLLLLFQMPSTPPQPIHLADPAVDTLIPQGHTLYPLEVTNLESALSLLGPTGVVQLISAKTGKTVATGVKVLRPAKNPSLLTALVEASDKNLSILANFSPFQVIIENPTQFVGTNFVSKKRQPKRLLQIGYGEE